jgi:NADPH-dependent 2,4-dienoyl-CoA reductase/sulfur reductase-like enzyme
MPNVLIIGGSDAGISAALRIKELTTDAKITIMLKDQFPNFSICGLPFYISGEVKAWRNLAHRTHEQITNQGIDLLMEHCANHIDPENKSVTAVDSNGQTVKISYDKLILGTGAVSFCPPINGADLPCVFFLRWMDDCFALNKHLEKRKPESAIIVGAGYIGLEMADAFVLRGMKVTLLEAVPSVLRTVHESFGQIVEDELVRHGVEVFKGVSIEEIREDGRQLEIKASNGFQIKGDLVLIAAGASPESKLAQSAGIEVNPHGAIKVNRKMETNIADIYAAGDCVETWHQLLQKFVYMPLGTTAHKQGRIAGQNAVGFSRNFEGSLGTQVVKVFNLVIARTGLREVEAKAEGYDPLTVHFETWDHKKYYPGARRIQLRITADTKTSVILGAQIIGQYQCEVSKRVDILASAIFHRMTIEQFNDLDLAYTPPLSSPWDPVQMATQAWAKKFRESQS